MTDNSFKTTVEELNKILKTNSVIGEPIETEEKILIPVVKMGFGFGGGNNNTSGGAGAAAGIEPVSMVVVSKNSSGSDSIRVIDISKGNNTNKAINDLGLVITDLIKNYFNSDSEDYSEAEWQYNNEEDNKKDNENKDINDAE
ncbi:MAG: GerW family sporulation protein [Methanobrevibacter sp.]